jgi:plasmid stabilization system protein ParE
MAYKISWSDIALEDYHIIIDYLITQWSLSVAADFEKIVNGKLDNLSKQPFSGIKSVKNPIVRSISFTPHNRLYYRITSDSIELLTIIDTRRNPEKNPF